LKINFKASHKGMLIPEEAFKAITGTYIGWLLPELKALNSYERIRME
jgi:hypothetical protein